MGVPKFYRWLSERYPLINQLISDGRMLPEFDNLYLDMNGIIHACTHPGDNDIASTLTTREMILGIFRYIERTVNVIVKPKKLLFIAVDGVAPRAKLNQQRSRRFRAAEERVASIERARQKGEKVDETKIFDSNCITPGTEFMEMVGKHIRWFIRKKVKEDPLWKDLEVIFSGHDVPGEGEHKIMQYIRDQRAMPTYEPNLRHCMLGQDADLIMLGLVSHEPHFTLLREVIEFGGRKFMSTRQTVVKQTRDAKFQLLHLSVLREYIEVEFFGAGTSAFSLERERLIDDFVFLTFLVGNDFLPHLPTLDISENAFDVVFDAYKSVLKVDPGYLVENGEVKSFSRLEKLFTIIGKQEQDILERREVEAIKFAARTRRRGGGRKADTEEDIVDDMEREIRAMQVREETDSEPPPLEPAVVAGFVAASAVSNASGESDVETETSSKVDINISEAEPEGLPISAVDVPLKGGKKDYRMKYYVEKFKIPMAELARGGSIPSLEDLKQTYLSGLMWCLAYYSKGCVSWTWYFPYHYGPMLQDMDGLEAVAARIQFNLSEPFKPFQQLLGCLPPASANLLPAAYQWLMLGEHSPLKEFYPETFEVDMNGKKSPWEAVVLLPFIDERKLLKAEVDHCSVAAASAMGRPLYKSDLQRNEFGRMMKVRFSPACMDTVRFPQGYADLGFTDILNCQTEAVDVMYDISPGIPFKPEVIAGTVSPYPGFPSLGILPISGTRSDAVKLNIFGTPSKYKSMIIELQSKRNPFDPGTLDLSLLLGKAVYVNYPLSFEARVVSVDTEMKQYRCSRDLVREGTSITAEMVTITNKGAGEAHRWKSQSAYLQGGYLTGLGIPGTGGLDIGPITLTLGVLPLQGMERDFSTGARTKVFGKDEAVVPIQLALWSCPVSADPRFEETGSMPLKDLFPYDVRVLVTGGHYAGYMGRVVGPHGPTGGADDKVAAKVTTKERMSLKKEASSGGKKSDRRANSYLVDVEFTMPYKVPDFGLRIAEAMQDRYFSSRDVCRMTQLSPGVLGQVVGAVLVEAADGKEFDLGLNFRRNGQYQLLGFCRRVLGDGEEAANAVIGKREWTGRQDTMQIIGSAPDELDQAGESLIPQKPANNDKRKKGGKPSVNEEKAPAEEEEKTYWEYSLRAVDLLKEYKQRFKYLFDTLEKSAHQRKHSIQGLLGPRGNERLDEIVAWMKAQSFYALPRTPLATVAMSTDAIAALEQAANEKIAQEASDVGSIAPVVAHGLPSDLLFRGDIFSPTDVPPLFENPKNPRLGYRIVNVTSAIVPFGYNGTVVAIHGSSGFVEVLFDKEFAGGRPIAGANSKFKSALVPWAACLCTTTVDVGTGKVASRGHKHSNDQLARPAQPRPVMKPVPISNSPGIKSNKDIESLRSMLKRPVHTVTAAAAPVAMAAPIVPLQQGPITVSTKAPESLGGFRIIQRIGGDGGVSTEQKAPAPKKDKVVRKSDGTGFAALAAAATADVSDDDESNPAEEKRVAQLPKDCDVPEKKGDQKALRSLLSILQAGGGAINATAAAEDVPLISAAATESPTVELEETTADASAGAKKAPSKMVPPSVLLKKKKSSSNT